MTSKEFELMKRYLLNHGHTQAELNAMGLTDIVALYIKESKSTEVNNGN